MGRILHDVMRSVGAAAECSLKYSQQTTVNNVIWATGYVRSEVLTAALMKIPSLLRLSARYVPLTLSVCFNYFNGISYGCSYVLFRDTRMAMKMCCRVLDRLMSNEQRVAVFLIG